jgi:hypothetical protein
MRNQLFDARNAMLVQVLGNLVFAKMINCCAAPKRNKLLVNLVICLSVIVKVGVIAALVVLKYKHLNVMLFLKLPALEHQSQHCPMTP